MESRQHLPGAIFGGALAAAITALAWKLVGLLNPAMSGVFLLISGLAVGLTVRYLGHGYTARFRVVGVVFSFCVPVLAATLGAPLIGTQRELAIVVAGTFLAGLALAAATSVRAPTRDEEKALFQVGFSEIQKQPRNSWIVFFFLGPMSFFVLALLFGFVATTLGLDTEADVESELTRAEEVGRSWGEVFSPEECADMADQNLRNCGGGELCDQKHDRLLSACIEVARELQEQNLQNQPTSP